MQDLIEFKTPNGYVFMLKPELTYGEFLEVQKVITANIDYDMTTQTAKSFKATALFEAQTKTLQYIVKSAKTPEGKDITNIVKAVHDLPRTDGQALTDKINELTQENQIEEKKGGN